MQDLLSMENNTSGNFICMEIKKSHALQTIAVSLEEYNHEFMTRV